MHECLYNCIKKFKFTVVDTRILENGFEKFDSNQQFINDIRAIDCKKKGSQKYDYYMLRISLDYDVKNVSDIVEILTQLKSEEVIKDETIYYFEDLISKINKDYSDEINDYIRNLSWNIFEKIKKEQLGDCDYLRISIKVQMIIWSKQGECTS